MESAIVCAHRFFSQQTLLGCPRVPRDMSNKGGLRFTARSPARPFQTGRGNNLPTMCIPIWPSWGTCPLPSLSLFCSLSILQKQFSKRNNVPGAHQKEPLTDLHPFSSFWVFTLEFLCGFSTPRKCSLKKIWKIGWRYKRKLIPWHYWTNSVY